MRPEGSGVQTRMLASDWSQLTAVTHAQCGEFRGLEWEFLVKQSLEVRTVALKFDRGVRFKGKKRVSISFQCGCF